MTDTNIYRFDIDFGKDDWRDSPSWVAARAFLDANDIPAETTPAAARMWFGDDIIFIDQFYTSETGSRMVSMLDVGFVKEERWFPLKRRPEEFGVTLVRIDRTAATFPSEGS